MLKKIILLVVTPIFLLSCDQNSIEIPQDLANSSEREIIETFLIDIETRLKNIDVKTNIRELPVIITDTLSPQIGGECHKGHYISINRMIIHSDQTTFKNSELWHTLLHEIGHCYFYLEHYDKQLYAPQGSLFAIESLKESNDGRSSCFFEYRKSISGTVMSANYFSYTNSDSLKQFYVNEISGQTDSSSFLNTKGVRLVNIDDQPVSCP